MTGEAGYFGGKARAKASPCSTHPATASSAAHPAGSTSSSGRMIAYWEAVTTSGLVSM